MQRDPLARAVLPPGVESVSEVEGTPLELAQKRFAVPLMLDAAARLQEMAHKEYIGTHGRADRRVLPHLFGGMRGMLALSWNFC